MKKRVAKKVMRKLVSGPNMGWFIPRGNLRNRIGTILKAQRHRNNPAPW